MIKTLAKEMIDDILKAVEYITYTNGKRIKRIYDSSGMPEEVIDLDAEQSKTTQSSIALTLMHLS